MSKVAAYLDAIFPTTKHEVIEVVGNPGIKEDSVFYFENIEGSVRLITINKGFTAFFRKQTNLEDGRNYTVSDIRVSEITGWRKIWAKFRKQSILIVLSEKRFVYVGHDNALNEIDKLIRED